LTEEQIEDFHKVITSLLSYSENAAYLGDCFFVTGNAHMSEVHHKLAGGLRESMETLRRLSGAISAQQLKDAEQSAFNTMTGVLAGMRLGEQHG